MCLAYALLDLSTLPTLHAARTLGVPLRGGPLALRRTLQQCMAAAAPAAPAHAPKVRCLPAVPDNIPASSVATTCSMDATTMHRSLSATA